MLRRRPRGWYWTDRRRASDLADIRSSGGPPVQLIEAETGRVVGTVDASSAHGTAHPGAVYLHMGETWLVTELDLDESVAVVVPADPDYSTSAREITDIDRDLGMVQVLGRLALERVDVLKVSHHGSADAGLPDLLRRLRPCSRTRPSAYAAWRSVAGPRSSVPTRAAAAWATGWAS